MTVRKEKLDGRQDFAWVLATEIEMAPPQFGRPLRTGDVRSIAAAFDPDKFGAMFLWFRPDLPAGRGRYTTIDGQHRLAAIRLMGYDDQRVPCVLYEGLTMETAAELSLGLQDRRNLHSLDRFRAELAAHERRAVEIDKVTHAVGIELSYAVRPNAVRKCSAIAQLGNMWDVMGPAGLERVLRVCDASWEGTAIGFGAAIMKLVTILVAAHNGAVNDTYLAEVLAVRSPAQWIARDQVPRRPLVSIAQDVIMEYNKRRRGGTRLPELTPSEYVIAVKRPGARTVRGPIEGVVTAASKSRRRR